MSRPPHPSRRQFLEDTLTAPAWAAAQAAGSSPPRPIQAPESQLWRPDRVDLGPARWIWLPGARTLPNTFVLFRKEFACQTIPSRALAWIAADSRYRISVNGKRLQWGPAPCDPRHLDVDPLELTPHLTKGLNVIGIEVLFYGHGEGTWAAGKPGLLFHGLLEYPGGHNRRIVSDASWLAFLDRAHPPGMYKRWFLRSLQEQFDARIHPHGWDRLDFHTDPMWVHAAVLDCPADKPIAAGRTGYSGDTIDRADPAASDLRLRQIPPVEETLVQPARLAHAGRIHWLRPPDDWFESRIPGSYRIEPAEVATPRGDAWELPATPGPGQGVYATWVFPEQLVGWPRFSIDAPEGATVELMIQESHDPQANPWLDTHFHSWSRWLCRPGLNRFEAFDYESFRWLQIHVHNAPRPVLIREVGARRRKFPWPNQPQVRCSDPALQKLLDASLNTLHNSAIETIVDGMGRERQQYSGDCGHQLHAVRYAFGETRIARRYLRTFSEGLTPQGYFLDCWPAFDRLARVMQKQIDGAFWGPLLDHGVGLGFDCWNHYLETGEREALEEPYPRLARFAGYLASILGSDGLLPVEGLGLPTVWIDHNAYRRPRHKQCAFNLYAAAMLRHALAPLAEVMGEGQQAGRFGDLGLRIQTAAVRRFWSRRHGLFVNNLPWLAEEGQMRLCDRSLATAILFDQCPRNDTAAALQALLDCPPEMGFSYPANAGWRLWALSKLGRADAALPEFRTRWMKMRSVQENNTLQEDWDARAGGTAEWSHCPVVPLYFFFMDILGIRPAAPGFTACRIRPQLAGLASAEATAFTVRGPIRFQAEAVSGGHRIRLELPAGCQGELLAAQAGGLEPAGPGRFRLPSGKAVEFVVGRP